MSYLLAIDQGTTSSRAIVFSKKGELIAQHQLDLMNYYPKSGYVEQDPQEMWQKTLECCQKVISTAKPILAMGITNQRETTLIWDKKTGQTIYPAIVWQDRRTSDLCKTLSKTLPFNLKQKTGLLLDPYFSATKILWILEQVPFARERAEKGELAFGTVDCFLLWRLTKGKVHATDVTNASRTLLFNIHTQAWDEDILHFFNIPKSLLPVVLNSHDDFGKTHPDFLGDAIPIASLIGDQQAAAVGQTCFKAGTAKSTYGTGCFILLNTGNKAVESKNNLLTTILYQSSQQVTYGLEGSIFCSGTIIKWLRDSMKFIQTSAESETKARSVDSTEDIYLIPAFTGLGAPHWLPDVRAAIVGLTTSSKIEHIVRAGLEAIAYQTRDLLEAMEKDSQQTLTSLKVDGGMIGNAWLMQFLADMLNVEIQLARYKETTALGAAYLAGLQIGLYSSFEEIALLWKPEKIFTPNMPVLQREKLYQGWKQALKSVIVAQNPLL